MKNFNNWICKTISIVIISVAGLSLSYGQKFKGDSIFIERNEKGLAVNDIQIALDEAYNKFRGVTQGKNADYIRELANVDPNIFGIALVTTKGKIFLKGDCTSMVSIQSVS